MCGCRTTQLLSPHPHGISYVSMILKRGCASRTPLEYKTPEAKKSVHANEARPPEERRPRGDGPRQPRREGPGMGGAGGWSWHGMLYREAMLPAPRRKEAMRI